MGERAGLGPKAFHEKMARHGGINVGIIGAEDPGHQRGPHRSRNRLVAMGKADDYSLQFPEDWEGDGDAVRAADLAAVRPELLERWTRNVIAAAMAGDLRVCVGGLEIYGRGKDGSKVDGYWLGSDTTRQDDVPASSDPSHLDHIHAASHNDKADDVRWWLDFADVMLGIPAEVKDWFAMATKEELREVVREELKALLDLEKLNGDRINLNGKRINQNADRINQQLIPRLNQIISAVTPPTE